MTDLPVEGSVVRLWSDDGPANRTVIERHFRPLLKSGFVHPYAALMPDYHPGEGSMIGSVVPTRGVVLPGVVGGDIGCGMSAVPFPLEQRDVAPRLEDLDTELRRRIPVGTAHNATLPDRVRDAAVWKKELRAPVLGGKVRRKLERQLGTLGGGNHFLEIQTDAEGRVWAMVHSGSRYLGVAIRDHYLEEGARQSGVDARLYRRVPYLEVGSAACEGYLADVDFALSFARASRLEMMTRVAEVLAAAFPDSVDAEAVMLKVEDVPHNFVARETHFGESLFVHRKGATRAREGETGMIPGSMGSASFVTEGRGNAFSFESCSHGAGRAMSRSAALRAISERQLKGSMGDVMYRYDDRLRDEAPAAYKDIRRVMRAQRDLVKVRHELRPLLSIKGAS